MRESCTFRTKRLGILLLAAAMFAIGAGGCSNAGQGAFSGAAIGAAGGAIIGAISGDAGVGAAIGAVSGAIAGGVIGDQNHRRDVRARYEQPVVIERYEYQPPPDGRRYDARERYLRRHGEWD